MKGRRTRVFKVERDDGRWAMTREYRVAVSRLYGMASERPGLRVRLFDPAGKEMTSVVASAR